MGLIVRELTELSGLRTRFLAGRGGGDREVSWAHSTELPDPWNWLGPGELLLTSGLSIPRRPDAQVDFLRELDRAGLAGIVLDEGPNAPEISAEARRTADELGFPFLVTEHSMPWTLLVRLIVDSNAQKRQSLVTKVLRVYDVMRGSYYSQASGDRLLAELSTACDCALFVVDGATGASLLPSREPLAESTVRRVVDLFRGATKQLPAFSRVAGADQTTFVLPVAEGSGALLVATPLSSNTDVDLMVLQHVSMIAGLEIERRNADALRVRENGSRLLQQMLAATIDPESALVELGTFGLATGPWRLLSWPDEAGITAEEEHALFASAAIPALLTYDGSEQLVLVPADSVDALAAALEPHPRARVGVSLPIRKLGRLEDAVREARWAQQAARASSAGICVYGEDTSPFLPRSIAEGEAVIERILGPVFEYDRRHKAQLVRSLVAYFDANRVWQEAADALGIHRQTLVYRIARVEQLTERRMQNVEDQTQLYLAVRTWKMLSTGQDHA